MSHYLDFVQASGETLFFFLYERYCILVHIYGFWQQYLLFASYADCDSWRKQLWGMYSPECKCWKLSCEHIAFSVMLHLLSFFLGRCLLPLRSTWLHSACVWRPCTQTTWPHATWDFSSQCSADWKEDRQQWKESLLNLFQLLLLCMAVRQVPVSCCVYPSALTQWPS